MKIGIGLPNQVRDVTPAVLPRWASQAEEAGFSTLGTVGRIAYPGVLDTVALAAAAAVTSRIGLFSNVMLAPVWPPVLLAKELAGIDGISGGRLTLGAGIGGREDDFVVDGLGPRGLGKRMDHDLEVYRSVWGGKPVGGGANPAVTSGSRQIPLMFGGFAPAALARMAKWGEGYIGASMPASMVAQSFDGARAAWREAGREGEPRLVAIAYFALGDTEQGRRNVGDYYANLGEEMAGGIAAGLHGTADAVREAVRAFDGIGADELIFNPGTDDPDDIARLADLVL
ncbi:LLM class flavin-dependent oxidoreductase [Umezawaea tangerina]|uniref:Alkanesulfonate monooxygenase SsuD/methylene tetrahydromethanopterin reductase-like flavin-dependent oxidoreductase (Luciferase family) n=1 Tax=Umezawaea tangerina TaxID=84725 RepID=A0A2T0SE39_9PSEU|nr:LLM class flavin-dependent oxidoreductase [Umezawaea tangerina]PRY31674.1 alkanesulfonate monooxygenase SsuD/methylene tetrahydromethanopterin reductase-like flavin-dependent oxidoreductase (luciferase family) [Umezawaea tangerina]